jgi:2-polyprenyl-3-methyl-5-hydroxy-6-metoxy-1,4-benzoquinol methylase
MHILSNVYVWNLFRKSLEFFFGLYSKRIAAMKDLGFKGTESLLDIGCGVGQYSEITTGKYLGIDLSETYIQYARRLHPSKDFRCMNVTELRGEKGSFQTVLLVDTIHHLSESEVLGLFSEIERIHPERIFFFEPLTQAFGNFVGRFLTALDRGSFIRPKNQLLELIQKKFTIEKKRDVRLMSVEGIGILCRIKKEPNEGIS